MAVVKRRGWIYAVALVGGLLIGSLIGKLCADSRYLWWLGYSIDFGFRLPESVTIDIYLMKLTFSFGVWFQFNVASILGMAVSALLLRRW